MKKERRSKQRQIAKVLRERIVRGDCKPGDMLPPRLQLASELGVSVNTLQRAFDHLTDDGFISAKGGQGTYVARRPPHLTNYGLVFHSDPHQLGWGRFSQALMDEASAIGRSGERQVPCYLNAYGHTDSEDYQKLVRDSVNHRVTGLIFSTNPLPYFENTPPMEEPGIPRVAIMNPSAANDVDMPIVYFDYVSLFDRAIDFLADHGRKSVAVLMLSGDYKNVQRDPLMRSVARRGLRCEPYWLQYVHAFNRDSVKNATHLLLQPHQTQRPDALIVSDDTMLDAAVAGLLAAGVRVPEDVMVVSHWNFPTPFQSPLPIRRVGFDVREVLAKGINLIDEQRAGRPVSQISIVPARFEEEIDGGAGASFESNAWLEREIGIPSNRRP